MQQKVPEDSICMFVVKGWQRLMQETAQDRGHDLSSVQPFPPFEQTYSDVMYAIRNGSREGLRFYRSMVKQLPWFSFTEGVPCYNDCKHIEIKD